MKPMDIIFIGAVLVIIGGIVGAIGTRMQNKASSAKSDKQLAKIQDLNDQNTHLSNSIANLSTQNSSLSQNISSLSGQNSKLISELTDARKDVDNARQESLDNTFGSMGGIVVMGDSFLKIYNDSKLPMYDVKIFLTNYDGLLNCEKRKNNFDQFEVKNSCYISLTKQYTIAILYGETVMDFSDFFINQQKPFKIMVKIITKKGTYYQQLIHSPALGTAYRILEQTNTGQYWKQYLDKVPQKPMQILKETFKVVKEKSLRTDPVDWNQEFPLPVSFNLFN